MADAEALHRPVEGELGDALVRLLHRHVAEIGGAAARAFAAAAASIGAAVEIGVGITIAVAGVMIVIGMPVGIAPVDRIIVGIGIAVGADTWLCRVPCVGLDEAAKLGIVIAGVQIHEPALGVIALADVALQRRHLQRRPEA